MTLGDVLAQHENALGPPDSPTQNMYSHQSFFGGHVVLASTMPDIPQHLWTPQQRVVFRLSLQFGVGETPSDVAFHLDGISQLSTSSNIIAVFGQPTSVSNDFSGNYRRYVYDNPNSPYDLEFMVNIATGRVSSITLQNFSLWD